MVSKTKFIIDNAAIKELFDDAGINNVLDIEPLSDGEFNAVFCARSSDKEYVIKIAPSDSTLVMTYEKGMMEAELYWYSQFREHTTVVVPKIYYKDFSRKRIRSSYFIMEKINGVPLNKVKLPDADARLATLASQAHRIRGERFGYIQNGLYDDWYQALCAMTANIVADSARAGKPCPNGEKLLEYIRCHRNVLAKADCRMVIFDIWLPNMIYSHCDGKTVFTWLDPERCFWGDRIADFVCLETFKSLTEHSASLEAYNNLSDTPVFAGADEQIRFAAAQGYLALILETERYFRYTRGHFGWWRNTLAAKAIFGKAFGILS